MEGVGAGLGRRKPLCPRVCCCDRGRLWCPVQLCSGPLGPFESPQQGWGGGSVPRNLPAPSLGSRCQGSWVLCLFAYSFSTSQLSPDPPPGPGNEGVNRTNGQSYPAGARCLVVEKDDFTHYSFVTMVMTALRSIRYRTWEHGSLLALAQDLPCLWPQQLCWVREPGGWTRCPASFLQTAGPACCPKKRPLLPTPVLRVGK